MMNKKAVELSMQTVVVALILLIVAGVVVFYFVSNTGKSNDVVNTGLKSAGACLPGSKDPCNLNCPLMDKNECDKTTNTCKWEPSKEDPEKGKCLAQ